MVKPSGRSSQDRKWYYGSNRIMRCVRGHGAPEEERRGHTSNFLTHRLARNESRSAIHAVFAVVNPLLGLALICLLLGLVSCRRSVPLGGLVLLLGGVTLRWRLILLLGRISLRSWLLIGLLRGLILLSSLVTAEEVPRTRAGQVGRKAGQQGAALPGAGKN